MNKILYFCICCMFTLWATSCDKEDELEPLGMKEDYFTVSPDATDPLSVMRREFHKKNGIHLFFTDTLRHEQRGTYADGTPFWYTETIDLNYAIPNSGSNDYRLTYLANQTDREESIRFVENYIIPRLGGNLRPYSLLLLQQLHTYDSYRDRLVVQDFCNNFRCLAISTGSVIGKSDDEKKAFGVGIFKSIITNKLSDELLKEFYVFCDPYYNEDYEDCDLPSGMDPDNMSLHDVRTIGFLREAYTGAYYFRSKNNDRNDYITAVFDTPELEFKAAYVDYPVVLQKYDILKQIITDLGYKF